MRRIEVAGWGLDPSHGATPAPHSRSRALSATLVDRVRDLATAYPMRRSGTSSIVKDMPAPKGKPYTTRIVRWIRWRYQIPPVTLQRPEELTVQQVAQHFGVNKLRSLLLDQAQPDPCSAAEPTNAILDYAEWVGRTEAPGPGAQLD